ncbi:MAG TPA: hypothetical protein VG368_01025 [Acidimicrobiales bacterium]|jgi:hypothetical protein|nr:hypothetical protein [Acidimicrobiales bacterium]
MTSAAFSLYFDYRCPFARNASEHVIEAVRSGAPYDVEFRAFSQSQGSEDPGRTPVWEDPAKFRELIAGAAGIVVRDRFPDQFFDAHLSLFAIRHDDGEDLRDEGIVRRGLSRVGLDADLVWKEIDDGWPIAKFRAEHEESITRYRVFGVPTFVSADEAVFVRLMQRPAGDAKLARSTIDRIFDLMTNHPEINEYKHTSLPY